MSSAQIGQPAPDFELQDQHGQPVRLSSFRGEKAVVLMFYPFAFSRVCTGELGEVQQNLARIEELDAVLLAISCDMMFSLRAFAEQDGLGFPLLSDFWPHGEVARRYGVFDEQRGCPSRSTYVVDREGVLRWEVHQPMSQARDLAEQLTVLEGLAGASSGRSGDAK